MKVIYEIVDSTSDENYFVCGLFGTMKEAIDQLKGITDPTDITPSEPEDYCLIEIRERKMGWDDSTGRKIFNKVFRQTYDVKNDEYKWTATESDK